MIRDEEAYPDAESFKPERFIKNGALNKEIRDPRQFVFGLGRRYDVHSIVIRDWFYVSSDVLESVLVASWLSAPSGRLSLPF